MAITPLTNPYSSYVFSHTFQQNQNSIYNLHRLIGLQNGTSFSGVQGVKGTNPVNAPFDLGQVYTNAQNDLNRLMQNLGYLSDDANAAEGTKDYLTTIKTASAQMQSALGKLMGTTSPSAFQTRSPVSSDTTKLLVEAGSGSYTGFTDIKVSIDQIASAQSNQGVALDAGQNVGGPELYEFQIESQGKIHQFSLFTTATDTNQTLQEKIAEAINEKGIGLNATVVQDTVNKTSALKIEAKETGQKNEFMIQDVYGDAIGRNQADTVTRMASDAIYRLNDGAAQTSGSNTIELGNSLRATLLDAAVDPVLVSMKADGSSAIKAMNDFVQSYNDLLSAAKSIDTEKSLKLNYQLASAINTYAPSLGRVGIQMDANGKMSINKETLSAASSNGELEALFGRDRYTNYGFGNRLNDIATDVNRNPMKYTDLSSYGLANYYSDIYSPFQTTKYGQAYNAGLFLNMFV